MTLLKQNNVIFIQEIFQALNAFLSIAGACLDSPIGHEYNKQIYSEWKVRFFCNPNVDNFIDLLTYI